MCYDGLLTPPSLQTGLPSEVLEKVLAHLPCKDLGKLSVTCKMLQQDLYWKAFRTLLRDVYTVLPSELHTMALCIKEIPEAKRIPQVSKNFTDVRALQRQLSVASRNASMVLYDVQQMNLLVGEAEVSKLKRCRDLYHVLGGWMRDGKMEAGFLSCSHRADTSGL